MMPLLGMLRPWETKAQSLSSAELSMKPWREILEKTIMNKDAKPY
jgi:hypothetical protein